MRNPNRRPIKHVLIEAVLFAALLTLILWHEWPEGLPAPGELPELAAPAVAAPGVCK